MLDQLNLSFTTRHAVYYMLIFSVLSFSAISCSTESTPSYQLTTSSTPAEAGSVSPASGEHDEGSEVQLQATANSNWVFDGWEGDQTGSQNPVTVTMNTDKNISARFVKQEFALTVNTEGEGTVTETLVQFKQTDYEHGVTVQLDAISDEGWQFVEWQGDLQGSENPMDITMDAAKTVTAVFQPMEFTVIVDAEGPGTVTVDPDKEIYEYNETVQFAAMPNSDNEFLGWFNESGSFEMLEANFEYQITEDLDIAAYFSSVEDAFAIETIDIITTDGVVDRVIFIIFNILLGDVALVESKISNEEGEDVAEVEFSEPLILTKRTGLELTVTFEGDLMPGEDVISDWTFNWMFDYKGERYEKEQEVGEADSNAKQKSLYRKNIETGKSISVEIK